MGKDRQKYGGIEREREREWVEGKKEEQGFVKFRINRYAVLPYPLPLDAPVPKRFGNFHLARKIKESVKISRANE